MRPTLPISGRCLLKGWRVAAHGWASPNTVIGLVFGLGGAFGIDRKNAVFVVQGGWMARIFGPLYLPLTLLCYGIGFVRSPKHAHDASPLEIWADAASGNAQRNAYLCQKRGG